MKNFFILTILTLSLSALAQDETAKETDDANAAYHRMIKRKREMMMQKQEETKELDRMKRNDDFDPSLDPVDDQLTHDEGVNDD